VCFYSGENGFVYRVHVANDEVHLEAKINCTVKTGVSGDDKLMWRNVWLDCSRWGISAQHDDRGLAFALHV
jgi:hypothetical protein